MDTLSLILTAAALVLGVFILVKILAAPIKLIFKLLLNTVSGFFLLLLVDIVGGFFDFSLSMTLLNILVAGCFGIPGVLFLIIIKLI